MQISKIDFYNILNELALLQFIGLLTRSFVAVFKVYTSFLDYGYADLRF